MLSGMMQNTACFRSPSFPSSMVSRLVIRWTSGKVKGASRTDAVMRMLMAVSLGACLNTLYWRRAIWFGFSSSRASKRRSRGD